jgi:metal-responsive CopG/Arc/MetJ family transcriptional regulator
MATQQLLLHLPDELVRRLKRAVPARQRSRFIQDLLEQALPPEGVSDSDPLYQAALAVEHDKALSGELSAWEQTRADGLGKS